MEDSEEKIINLGIYIVKRTEIKLLMLKEGWVCYTVTLKNKIQKIPGHHPWKSNKVIRDWYWILWCLSPSLDDRACNWRCKFRVRKMNHKIFLYYKFNKEEITYFNTIRHKYNIALLYHFDRYNCNYTRKGGFGLYCILFIEIGTHFLPWYVLIICHLLVVI